MEEHLVSVAVAVAALAAVIWSIYRRSSRRGGVGTPHPACALSRYSGCVYLDYNATTPIFPEVARAMKPYAFECFGNPSSPHVYGRPCKEAITKGRFHVKELIGAEFESEIVFCSCGSETDNRAIDIAIHAFKANAQSKPCVITCTVEHPAVLKYLDVLHSRGEIDVIKLPVDVTGLIQFDDLRHALSVNTHNTALVTIMHSNNEVGTMQPIAAICALVKAHNEAYNTRVLVHSDAAQSIGKVFVNVQTLGVDMLSIVGHKFGAPKGVAALYVSKNTIPHVAPLLIGGAQELGRRAGTENVLLIVGLGEACRIFHSEWRDTVQHMLAMKTRLIRTLREHITRSLPGAGEDFVRFNGPDNEQSESENLLQLPNTVSVSFKNVRASQLMPVLADKVAVSAGSACHSSHALESMSAVLAAMKVPPEYGLGTLRLSLGRHTTPSDIDKAVREIVNALRTVRGEPRSCH